MHVPPWVKPYIRDFKVSFVGSQVLRKLPAHAGLAAAAGALDEDVAALLQIELTPQHCGHGLVSRLEVTCLDVLDTHAFLGLGENGR